MANKAKLKLWSSNQAVAILSVDNIQLSDFGRDLLKQREDGIITHKQAKEEILKRYKVASPNSEQGDAGAVPQGEHRMKSTFMSEFAMAARQGPRLFFAPLVGAVNGVRDELRRIADENAKCEITEPPSDTDS